MSSGLNKVLAVIVVIAVAGLFYYRVSTTNNVSAPEQPQSVVEQHTDELSFPQPYDSPLKHAEDAQALIDSIGQPKDSK